MSLGDYLSVAELRAILKVSGTSKDRTWRRVKPFFAPALRAIPYAGGQLKLYSAAKVQELLEGRSSSHSPLRRSRALRKLDAGVMPEAPAPTARTEPPRQGDRVPLLRQVS